MASVEPSARTAPPIVVFRADASVHIGAGHVVRCVALAHALHAMGARCLFVSRSLDGQLSGWVREQGFETADLPATPTPGQGPRWVDQDLDLQLTTAAVGDTVGHANWLVIDHYAIDASWEQAARALADRLLVIDDLANRSHAADLLLDQGVQEVAARYTPWLAHPCPILLGPKYALLRPEFAGLAAARENQAKDPAQTILACMGGTDLLDVLSITLTAWRGLPTPRPPLDLVVGASSPNVVALARGCEGLAGLRLHVATNDMAELMAGAQLVISSAGGIGWERCSAGLPAIFGRTAPNQTGNLGALVRHRTGFSVGDWSTVTPEQLRNLLARLLARPGLRRRMGERAHRMVDGLGATRVACHMLMDGLWLRGAAPADATLVYPWRNAASTRRYFHDPAPVSLERHVAWWELASRDPGRALLIAAIGHRPVGVLRLDRAEEAPSAMVSIYTDPALAGLGLGARMLATGKSWASTHWPDLAALTAEINTGNAASIKAFERAGFAQHQQLWRCPLTTFGR